MPVSYCCTCLLKPRRQDSVFLLADAYEKASYTKRFTITVGGRVLFNLIPVSDLLHPANRFWVKKLIFARQGKSHNKRFPVKGSVAEGLGRALQKLVQRFESARNLHLLDCRFHGKFASPFSGNFF